MTDWIPLLEKYGFQTPLREEFSICCPFHDDRSPSLSINVRKGVWICHAGCGGGTLRQFLERYTGEKIYELGLPDSSFADLLEEDETEDAGPLIEVSLPFKIGQVPAWIFDRDFTKRALKKWGCGMTDAGDLVIPVLDEHSRTVGWVCRQANGRLPKYVYNSGLKTSKIVFGVNRIPVRCELLCVTEGTLDTIWMDQNGFMSVALLGLNMSRFQENLIKMRAPKEILLCLDNDAPGQEGVERIGERLSRHSYVSVLRLPDGVKDVQDVRDSGVLGRLVSERSVI